MTSVCVDLKCCNCFHFKITWLPYIKHSNAFADYLHSVDFHLIQVQMGSCVKLNLYKLSSNSWVTCNQSIVLVKYSIMISTEIIFISWSVEYIYLIFWYSNVDILCCFIGKLLNLTKLHYFLPWQQQRECI